MQPLPGGVAKPAGWGRKGVAMRQQRVTKRKRVTDKRRTAREDEPQEEKPEIRPDLRHWFTEANT